MPTGRAGPRGDAAPAPRMEVLAPAAAWAPASGPLQHGCISRAARVLPRQEGGGRLPVVTLAGALLGHPAALGVLLKPLGAGRGPGGLRAPPAAELGSLGAQRGERWPVPLCVCVCAHPLLPRGCGAPALHLPPCLGPLVVISSPSAEYTFFLLFFFFPPFSLFFSSASVSAQLRTAYNVKPSAF